jgi:hypothetical protein
MSYEFRVTVVATREHYEADGSIVPVGTRWPADPEEEVPDGWRLDVERAEVEAPPAEPKATIKLDAPDSPRFPAPSAKEPESPPPSKPPHRRGDGRRAP